MDKKISKESKKELLEALKKRYLSSSKKQKTRILDEFTVVSGYHRKYATRLLRADGTRPALGEAASRETRMGRRIYDEAVKEALIVLWEAGDRICGKRLKAILPQLVDALERHRHFELDPEVKKRLLLVSPATIDRLLAPVRSRTHSQRKNGKLRKSARVFRCAHLKTGTSLLPGISKSISSPTAEVAWPDLSSIRSSPPISVLGGPSVCP